VGCFVRERRCHFVSLAFIMPRFKIVQDRVRIGPLCLVWQGVVGFLVVALPFLDHSVAGFSQGVGPCCRGEEAVFSRLAVIDNLFTGVWTMAAAAVPMAAVVLEHRLCFWVITVNWRSLNPPLAAVAA